MAKSQSMTIENTITETSSILKDYPIKKGAIFGSFARGEANDDSDIDILIEPDYDSSFSYFDLVSLERKISEKIGRKIDLVTYNSLSPYIKDQVLKESKIFYERR